MADLDCQLDWIWNRLTNYQAHLKGVFLIRLFKEGRPAQKGWSFEWQPEKRGHGGKRGKTWFWSHCLHISQVNSLLSCCCYYCIPLLTSELSFIMIQSGLEAVALQECSVPPVSVRDGRGPMGQAVTRLSTSPVRSHFGLPGPY